MKRVKDRLETLRGAARVLWLSKWKYMIGASSTKEVESILREQCYELTEEECLEKLKGVRREP